jgi:hypothetical protein
MIRPASVTRRTAARIEGMGVLAFVSKGTNPTLGKGDTDFLFRATYTGPASVDVDKIRAKTHRNWAPWWWEGRKRHLGFR